MDLHLDKFYWQKTLCYLDLNIVLLVNHKVRTIEVESQNFLTLEKI